MICTVAGFWCLVLLITPHFCSIKPFYGTTFHSCLIFSTCQRRSINSVSNSGVYSFRLSKYGTNCPPMTLLIFSHTLAQRFFIFIWKDSQKLMCCGIYERKTPLFPNPPLGSGVRVPAFLMKTKKLCVNNKVVSMES